VGGEVLTEETCFVRPDRDVVENIIARILHGLTSTSRQKVNAARAILG
jgi:hypothetical protein